MEISVDRKLFWFLKEGHKLDLENPRHLDMYIQQVLMHGKEEEVRRMLHRVSTEDFRQSFERVKKYPPKEVRLFWEEELGNSGEHSKGNSNSP